MPPITHRLPQIRYNQKKNKKPQAINNEDAYQHLQNLEKISGITRKAIKRLISQNKPAIPPYYEKVFYNVAMEMGENKLITHLMSSVPTGQAATVMVRGVSTIITNLTGTSANTRRALTNTAVN
ncbi:MAG: hypothetical protein U9O82_01945 [Thermodesulfobacteriota bacterium]|nr:hypothetical protein [Thermodesulfobacteriota bacterium]